MFASRSFFLLLASAIPASAIPASAILTSAVLAAATVAAGGQGKPVSTLTTPAAAPELTAPAASLTPAQVESMQKQLADWPQLARYRAEDARLPPPSAGERRVVFLGDSITDFWGRKRGSISPGQPWINRGISGQTTPQMLLRFQQDVLDLHPTAVVLLGGINDIAGNTGAESLPEIEANIRSMAMLARAAGVRMVLSSVLPAASFPWRPGLDPRQEVVALNAWMAEFAKAQGMVFLNYYPALVGPDGGMRPGLSSDGVHPTDAGYAVMEPLARKAVEAALARPRP